MVNDMEILEDDTKNNDVIDNVIGFRDSISALISERKHLSKIVKEVRFATTQEHWIRIETSVSPQMSLTRYSSTANFSDAILKIAEDRIIEIDKQFKKIGEIISSI